MGDLEHPMMRIDPGGHLYRLWVKEALDVLYQRRQRAGLGLPPCTLNRAATYISATTGEMIEAVYRDPDHSGRAYRFRIIAEGIYEVEYFEMPGGTGDPETLLQRMRFEPVDGKICWVSASEQPVAPINVALACHVLFDCAPQFGALTPSPSEDAADATWIV